MKKSLLFIPCLLGSGFATLAQNLVVNGGFEGAGAIGYVNLPYNSQAIPGWTTGNGSVTWFNWTDAFPARSGSRFIELDEYPSVGSSVSVSQTLATLPGQEYLIGWSMSGDRGASKTFQSVDVTFGDQTSTFQYNVAAHSSHADGWEERFLVVRATSSSTILRFGIQEGAGGFDNDNGVFLDDISVVAIPEIGPSVTGAFILFVALLFRRTRK